MRAWDAAKQEGLAKNFSEGARTEEEYAESVEKLVRWWDGKQGEIIVA